MLLNYLRNRLRDALNFLDEHGCHDRLCVVGSLDSIHMDANGKVIRKQHKKNVVTTKGKQRVAFAMATTNKHASTVALGTSSSDNTSTPTAMTELASNGYARVTDSAPTPTADETSANYVVTVTFTNNGSGDWTAVYEYGLLVSSEALSKIRQYIWLAGSVTVRQTESLQVVWTTTVS